MQRPQTNRTAATAIVFALIGVLFFIFLIPQVLAIVLGMRAHKQMKAQPTVEQGQSMATAAIAIGIVEVVAFVGGLLYVWGSR